MRNVTTPEIFYFDKVSFLFSVLGFGGTVFGLNKILSPTGISITGLLVLCAGIISVIIFSIRQLKTPRPLLKISILQNRQFSLGISMILITHMMLFANFILTPMFLVNICGLNVFQAGLSVLPGGILGAVLPPIAGRLYDRIGPKLIAAFGYTVLALGAFLFSTASQSTAIPFVITLYALSISGIAVILTPIQTNSLNQLDRKDISYGTAIVNTVMLIGAALGASLFVGLMSARMSSLLEKDLNHDSAMLSGIQHAFRVISGFAVAGLTGALCLKTQ